MFINKEITLTDFFQTVTDEIQRLSSVISDTDADYFVYTTTELPQDFSTETLGLEYPYCSGITSVELGVDIKSYGVIREVSFRTTPSSSTIQEAISRFKFSYLNPLNCEKELPLFISAMKFPGLKKSKEWSFLAAGVLILPHIFIGNYKGRSFLRVIIPADELADFILLPGMLDTADNHSDKLPNITRTDLDDTLSWEQQVKKGIETISCTALEKVVLSRSEEYLLNEKINDDTLYRLLLNNNPRAHRYFLKLDKYRFFGATPEILINKEGNSVYTEALAGTLKLNTSDDNPDVSDFPDKDVKEHLFVRDFIEEVMHKYGAHIPRADMLQIKKAKTAAHLWSPLSAVLPFPIPLYQIALDLFPTPAVAGYPKEKSIEFINENEQFDRGMFTGILGILTSDNSGFYLVAIRCGLINHLKLTLFAGCGIVSDSDHTSEFNETKVKLATLLSLFADDH